jgi:tRNA(His) 5'-end guanylyltransferase
MRFKTLKEKQEYYRSLTDYRLLPNAYVIVMLDGRGFSKKVKNKFRKPFDERFVNAMNETAKYLCENISGCKFAYVQSDEISLVLTDFETPETSSFFDYRLSKLLSTCASAATAKFNACMLETKFAESLSIYAPSSANVESVGKVLKDNPLYEFDCKAWNVPTWNDVYGWILYRQLDCIRNSKQQTAQTYFVHKELVGLNCDEQIEKLKNEKDVDWESFDDGLKYGRFIIKRAKKYTKPNGEEFERLKFSVINAFPLNEVSSKNKSRVFLALATKSDFPRIDLIE